MPDQLTHQLADPRVQDMYRGCLLGGAVGDALGAPVEFMSMEQIAQAFGPGGIQEYVPAFGKLGAITDDTQMTLFTAEGVLGAWVRAFVHAPSAIPSQIATAYQRWLHTQGLTHPMHNQCLNGWLMTHRELFARRAPGNTCLSGLQDMRSSDDFADNESKGCGGVMRVAPVGMYCATLANASGANKDRLLKDAFVLGCQSAAITHGHPTGQLASGAFAAIIMQMLTGMDLEPAIKTTLLKLAEQPGHAETTEAIKAASRLAAERPNDAGALVQLGGGWTAEEALAIALYCALSAADFRAGVVLAVNHGGDSDSTGSMAGQLLGAMFGAKAIPPSWLLPLELRAVIETIADDLARFGGWKRTAVDERDSPWDRYAGTVADVDEMAQTGDFDTFDPLDSLELPVMSEQDLERQEAAELALAKWEQDFREDAKADDYRTFRAHLRRLDLPGEPSLLMEGTIQVVQMSFAYLALDNQAVDEFLSHQRYDASRVVGAPYQVTFDIHGKAYARINVPASLRQVDLADLYATPWNPYERVGYCELWISRVDGTALSPEEIADLEKSVEDDLRFDYDEEEVEFWFDPDTYPGNLRVVIQDVFDEREGI